MPTDDDHLRKLAETAAGKGTPRWCVRTNDERLVDEAEPGPGDVHEVAQNVAEVSTAEEAAYIAAANPQTILRLLDERDRLARALEVARGELHDNLSAEALAIADEAIDAILEGDHA